MVEWVNVMNALRNEPRNLKRKRKYMLNNISILRVNHFKMQKHTIPSLTKDIIRESALKELAWRGYDCWRQNNIAVRGRKFIGRKGVSDIIGFTKYDKGCKFIACEVKTINDRLSKSQIEFLTDVFNSGGIALIAKQSDNGHVELVEFNPKEYEQRMPNL
jgi:hypothetical protein